MQGKTVPTEAELISKGNELVASADKVAIRFQSQPHKLHEVTIMRHQQERIRFMLNELKTRASEESTAEKVDQLSRALNQLQHTLTLHGVYV